MKKYTSIAGIAAAVIGVFSLALPALAATTASLSPTNVSVVAGKSFTVTVAVNPQGVNNYAEKLEVDFPANNLAVTAFNLGSNWMALTQTGYDSTDNANGILVKTAGYPNGFSGVTTFGTITFYAKNSGSGIIKIGNSSLSFGVSNSQSSINGNGTTFVVSASAVAPAKTTVQTTSVVQVATNTTPTQVTQSAPITQAAAVAGAGAQSYSWLWWVLLIVVLAVVIWWMYVRKPNQNK